MSAPVRTYRLYDGTLVSGNSAAEIIDMMSEHKLTAPRDRASYRRAAARRARAVYGSDVALDPSTDESFFESMLQTEVLVPVV